MSDRTFGPSVLVGLAGSGLAATAGHKDWVAVESSARNEGAMTFFWESHPGLGQMPLAGALGLLLLACWGVVLVSRGRPRRAVAVLGLGTALALVATWVVGWSSLRDDVAARLATSGPEVGQTLAWTPWFFAAGVGAALAVAASAVAVVRVAGWPEMGSRYDAPATASAVTGSEVVAVDLSEADPTDVWKAIDEGHDPTR
ncbi:Trp biosynthesis-associated membrane protein [Nocardioides gilvus]|uniref:Trp biosynthesis-associated membrane protein n=1 Tax=Nocardioides gilvus TaxID=1735589 RepID=UPI000D74C40D|nr:Trp biosynthesis-associated membrane protein [Nocardioides gilvus]